MCYIDFHSMLLQDLDKWVIIICFFGHFWSTGLEKWSNIVGCPVDIYLVVRVWSYDSVFLD